MPIDKNLIKKNIEEHNKKAIDELVILSLNSKIKLDKNDYKLTKFIRDNMYSFVDIVEKYTPNHIEFIYRFLLSCDINEQKNTITTVYNRVKKEMENKN